MPADPEQRPESEDVPRRFRPWTVATVALAATAVAFAPLPLDREAHRTLVVLVAVAGLWLTEAVPVAAAALLAPLLGVLLGVTDAKGAFAGFGDPIVFLFMGTFLLTEAAAIHGMNARLARAVLGSRWVSAGPSRLLWAMGLLGCAISAFMNNTATTALLLPLALTAERFGAPRLLTGVLLMTSWAPSLGGIATPVGTAPNLIGLRLLEEATGARPSFAQWTLLFAPLAVVATAISALWLRARVGREGSSPVSAAVPERASAAGRTPWSHAERTLLPLFVLVIVCWITPGLLAATPLHDVPWVRLWRERVPEAVVPLAGGLLLFVLPVARGGGARILDAQVFRRLDWSTLLLFGGGLSLGAMMFESGLARTLGEWLFRTLPVPGEFGVVLAATVMAVVISELTSNTASAALVVPVVLALAQAAGVDPVKPALAATVACSFGFMLPVSTPPNALVYATGRVSMRQMVAHGLLLDVVGIALVSVWVTLLG